MKIFISWSGMNSKKIAKNLKNILKDVFETDEVQAFISDEDILAGREWYQVIKKELQESDCAILCITKENINSPWINFEAGAIAMQHNVTNVIPLLIDTDINNSSPLINYNTVKLNEENFIKLLKDLKQIGKLKYPSDKLLEKLSGISYNDFIGKIKDVLTQISEEYSSNKIIIYPSQINLLKKNSVFLGCPMSSLENEESYNKMRSDILRIKDDLVKSCGFDSKNIYCPCEQNDNFNSFDGEEKSIIENYKSLKESEFLFFIIPNSCLSGVFTEIGYGIALSKKIFIFTKDRKMLPFTVREADKAIVNVKIYTYNECTDISNILCRNGRAMF